MIPGDLLSAFPHRQFHTLPSLLDSWAVLPNFNPNARVPMQAGSLYHFNDGLWYDPTERRTHDLPCERRTQYRLSQPDTVYHGFEHYTLKYLTKITGIRILLCRLCAEYTLCFLCEREYISTNKTEYISYGPVTRAYFSTYNTTC